MEAAQIWKGRWRHVLVGEGDPVVVVLSRMAKMRLIHVPITLLGVSYERGSWIGEQEQCRFVEGYMACGSWTRFMVENRPPSPRNKCVWARAWKVRNRECLHSIVRRHRCYRIDLPSLSFVCYGGGQTDLCKSLGAWIVIGTLFVVDWKSCVVDTDADIFGFDIKYN